MRINIKVKNNHLEEILSLLDYSKSLGRLGYDLKNTGDDFIDLKSVKTLEVFDVDSLEEFTITQASMKKAMVLECLTGDFNLEKIEGTFTFRNLNNILENAKKEKKR